MDMNLDLLKNQINKNNKPKKIGFDATSIAKIIRGKFFLDDEESNVLNIGTLYHQLQAYYISKSSKFGSVFNTKKHPKHQIKVYNAARKLYFFCRNRKINVKFYLETLFKAFSKSINNGLANDFTKKRLSLFYICSKFNIESFWKLAGHDIRKADGVVREATVMEVEKSKKWCINYDRREKFDYPVDAVKRISAKLNIKTMNEFLLNEEAVNCLVGVIGKPGNIILENISEYSEKFKKYYRGFVDDFLISEF